MSAKKISLFLAICVVATGFFAVGLSPDPVKADHEQSSPSLGAERSQNPQNENIAENESANREARGRKAWFKVLSPVVNLFSEIGMVGRKKRFEKVLVQPETILEHEGKHRLKNTRYKEWWYFDAHAESGRVISAAIVLSIVRDHYFVWVYDPQTGKVSVEIEHDGDVAINKFGENGLELEGEFIKIKGDIERGYLFEFNGKNISGKLNFDEPVEARSEVHHGIENTFYSLYQVPKLNVTGELTQRDTGETEEFAGQGYHDHWWGIVNRVTKWAWLQVKFENGWLGGFYEGRYGESGEDLHRYAWLYKPETGYSYFDESTFKFAQTSERAGWTTSVSGSAGSLTVNSVKRIERHQYKLVELHGVPVGEVFYYQYPINATGQFTDSEGATYDLKSRYGMLEWDWDAVW